MILHKCKISHLIEILLYVERIYNLNPLFFCSLCTELRRFCCNFSHCSLNHCTMGCRFMVSTNLCSSVKSSSILQTASFIWNDCLLHLHVQLLSVYLLLAVFLCAMTLFLSSLCARSADGFDCHVCLSYPVVFRWLVPAPSAYRCPKREPTPLAMAVMASVALFFSCSVLASLLILASSLSARSFSASSRPIFSCISSVWFSRSR